MMSDFKILSIETEEAAAFSYLNVDRPGIQRRHQWPIHTGIATGLPAGIEALLVVSDLQGHADPMLNGAKDNELVGEFLPRYYSEYWLHFGWPNPRQVGVLLAGDLFALPDKRGGLGETRPVWDAFADVFAWAVGVFGNHDLINGKDARHISGPISERCWVLNGDIFDISGFVIGGVGGIIGRADKPNRFAQDRYYPLIIDALSDETDILILHEAPKPQDNKGRGSELITEAINDIGWQGTVICGHSYWENWYHPSEDSFSVLNVEGRAVLLKGGD